MSNLEQIGTVTTRSRGLIVIDTGCLGIWSHDFLPALPDGCLARMQTQDAPTVLWTSASLVSMRSGQGNCSTCIGTLSLFTTNHRTMPNLTKSCSKSFASTVWMLDLRSYHRAFRIANVWIRR
jgi:hypothetical protein